MWQILGKVGKERFIKRTRAVVRRECCCLVAESDRLVSSSVEYSRDSVVWSACILGQSRGAYCRNDITFRHRLPWVEHREEYRQPIVVPLQGVQHLIR